MQTFALYISIRGYDSLYTVKAESRAEAALTLLETLGAVNAVSDLPEDEAEEIRADMTDEDFCVIYEGES